jgi:ribose-phosphate pyrophosphokinase
MINIHSNEFFDIIFMPGGEPHVKWKGENLQGLNAHLLARINSANDLLSTLAITDSFKRQKSQIEITIPYWPGARQDRVSSYGECLTAKIYTDIINAQNYKRVNIIDPHSDVTPALLNNCNILPIRHIIQKIVRENKYDTIIIPDAGASKKMFSYYFPQEEDRRGLNFVQCLKIRDILTGKLSGFKVCDSINYGAHCLIVDDVADGCGTFIGLADKLWGTGYSFGIGKLGLYCTHGIFSKGTECLFKQETERESWNPFDEVFTTNSIRDQYEGVKVFDLF